jgi:putative ABC transport system substrate-binding protein
MPRAQQPILVIGFLSTRSPDKSANQLAGFCRGLAENGYVEGQNVTVEYRWALGQYDRMPTLAAEVVRQSIAVLVSVGGEPSVFAAKAATATTPIVATFRNLSRPGGNVTGVSNLRKTHLRRAQIFPPAPTSR